MRKTQSFSCIHVPPPLYAGGHLGHFHVLTIATKGSEHLGAFYLFELWFEGIHACEYTAVSCGVLMHEAQSWAMGKRPHLEKTEGQRRGAVRR